MGRLTSETSEMGRGASNAAFDCSDDIEIHGDKGVYYGGEWLDIEDCHNWQNPAGCATCPSNPLWQQPTPTTEVYDVVIIGAGCVGGAVARELAKWQLSVLVLEMSDD